MLRQLLSITWYIPEYGRPALTYIHYKVWDEITYPFPNLHGAPVEVSEWSIFIPHFIEHMN